jgi:hypothetical protein
MPFARTLKLFSLLLSVAFLVTLLSACTSPDSDDGDDDGGGGGPVVDEEDLNGIFLKIDGKSYALSDAQAERFSPVGKRQMIARYKGTVKFHDLLLDRATVTVSNTVPADSLQTCGAAATNAAITVEFGFGEWGGTYTATACQIKVEHTSQNGGMQGTVLSATLANTAGKTITLSHAKFRMYHFTGYAGAAPTVLTDAKVRATLQIDSGSFELAGGQHFLLSNSVIVGSGSGFGTATNDGNYQSGGNNNSAVVLSAISIPNAAGTWLCNQTFSGGKTNIAVSLGLYQFEMTYSGIPASGSNSGAACSLKVVGQVNGPQLVNYTGTLVAADNLLSLDKRKIKVRGMWRNYTLGKQLPVASEGAVRPDSQEAALTVDSTSWHFPNKGSQYRAAKVSLAKVSGLTAYNAYFRHGGTNKDFELMLSAVPSAAGTYACGALVAGTNPSQYRTSMRVVGVDTSGHAGIEYRAFASSETPGSNCSITVTASSDTSVITGTYTARLIASGAGLLLPDGDTTLSVSGSFRTKKQ